MHANADKAKARSHTATESGPPAGRNFPSSRSHEEEEKKTAAGSARSVERTGREMAVGRRPQICYLANLSINLLRQLSHYLSFEDWISLTETCIRFTKLQGDRYVKHCINFFGETEDKDLRCAIGLRKLALGNLVAKTYTCTAEEMLGMFHIDHKRKRFYSLYEGTLIVGRFGNEAEIETRRPIFRDILAVDGWKEDIVCVNNTEIALSTPHTLTTERIRCNRGVPTSVKFMGSGNYIIVNCTHFIFIFSKELQKLKEIYSFSGFEKMFVPKPSKCIFVSYSHSDNTTMPNLCGYAIKDVNCIELFQRRYDNLGAIKHLEMYRATCEGVHLDFLIVLFECGKLLINNRVVGTDYVSLACKEEVIISFWAKTEIHMYRFNPVTRALEKSEVYSLGDVSSVSMHLWKNIGALVMAIGIIWFRKSGTTLKVIAEADFQLYKFTFKTKNRKLRCLTCLACSAKYCGDGRTGLNYVVRTFGQFVMVTTRCFYCKVACVKVTTIADAK